MPTWAVEWNGTITRDRGWVDVQAETAKAAKAQYEAAHPYRRVVSVIDDAKWRAIYARRTERSA